MAINRAKIERIEERDRNKGPLIEEIIINS